MTIALGGLLVMALSTKARSDPAVCHPRRRFALGVSEAAFVVGRDKWHFDVRECVMGAVRYDPVPGDMDIILSARSIHSSLCSLVGVNVGRVYIVASTRRALKQPHHSLDKPNTKQESHPARAKPLGLSSMPVPPGPCSRPLCAIHWLLNLASVEHTTSAAKKLKVSITHKVQP
ncbi:hypothetical protein BDV23DRAFT_146474 [Aspergillus alliaceus]|uniref:Secreted protein n=1 Tax=Petromyces alliaceus TaxID=209559 RepID=A0A5N7CMD8_PETAA|nr:hypothetical protein BDV23DRAFT_146474 [Aspergillus alliaceus]